MAKEVFTETGYNMFDLISMEQKSIRRGNYENGGWACYNLKGRFRSVMWNRMLITSCEDCYGVLTKEIVALKEKDDESRNDIYPAQAMALLCRAKKSRDACYLAANFVIDCRKPREIEITPEQASDYQKRMKKPKYDKYGFAQEDFLSEIDDLDEWGELEDYGIRLQIAIEHRDMDMIGWYINQLRELDWYYIFDVYDDYAQNHSGGRLADEMKALRKADQIFNRSKPREKWNDIYTSKGAIILCYGDDPNIEDDRASSFIQYDRVIDWTDIKVKPLELCQVPGGKIPDYVYDYHTLKGRRSGKTDWDMTRDEQAALNPLAKDYFSNGSWIYTYEQDYRNNVLNDRDMFPIREFAKTHPANPVKFIPYD